MRSDIFFIISAFILITGATALMPTHAHSESYDNLSMAVTSRDKDAVEKMLVQGADPNSEDERGKSVLLVAAGSDQFRIANMLVAHGATIWTSDSLGNNPASMAYIAMLKAGSPEDKAKDQFIDYLKKSNYPWPPPRPVEIRALKAEGKWPPLQAGTHGK